MYKHNCGSKNNDICTLSSAPDAENFGLPDAEEGRFDLWLVAFLAGGREATAVDIWVLLLKLETKLKVTFPLSFAHVSVRTWPSGTVLMCL